MHQDQPLLLLLLLFLLHRSFSIAIENNPCTTSCGEVANISYPFRLMGDPKSCGHSDFELACIHNRTILDFNSSKYFVHNIDYINQTIRIADVKLQKGDCSSLPLQSLCDLNGWHNYYCFYYNTSTVSIVSCVKAMDFPFYIDATSCLDGHPLLNFSSARRRVYALVNANVSSVETACTIEFTVILPWWVDEHDLRSYAQIHERMVYGFELSWWYPWEYLEHINIDIAYGLAHTLWRIEHISFLPIGFVRYKLNLYSGTGNHYLDVVVRFLLDIVLQCMVVKFILGAPCVMTLLIRKWKRRHLAMDQNVEEFLQSNNNFLPIRYSYSDIKKITSGLKDKLGEGGYGSVFKGRLRSGREVAVKILKKGKTNGQDFISEVATIGRIHHVNVVGLIGYCFEGSKQGLVYDFMHNGSLDKHIFSREQGISLECKEVYEIALGVARGIEYLHRGCDIQILHFDIKPHNILLDEDFTPKVSDFGLARLYPTDYNTVSLTAARGTLGYMAPELVFKNLGGVSYKADVYSFGKLLMEMATRRKNEDKVTGCSSHTYFPLWVHDQIDKELEIPVEVSEDERKIIKKMIIVALWCIQWNPDDRPSMQKVLKMLEGEVDDLQISPKPLFYATEMSRRDDGTWTDEGNNTISTTSTSAITYEDSGLECTSISITQA
ncbi:hypothetical protein EUGRSUZ_K00484 [Eucalyptus grandis]|uniref:Protein kinase domain-containing protein n=2 Tax=Eucalyptus grandis TaxID=71139 RepID=A0A059A016_EUCGR|nr:hypothetical protein EUGRSUZ_K00484 [Eucalyptus grandis]